MAEIKGRKFKADESKFHSWAVFELLGVISDETASPYERVNCMFKLVEIVTDLDKAAVIDMAGGEDADVQAVFDTLAAIIAEVAPKN